MNYQITELESQLKDAYEIQTGPDNVYLRHGAHRIEFARPATRSEANSYCGTHDAPDNIERFLKVGMSGEKRVPIANQDWFSSLIAWKRAAVFHMEDAVTDAIQSVVHDLNESCLLSVSAFSGDCAIEKETEAWTYKWKNEFTFKLSIHDLDDIDGAKERIIYDCNDFRHRSTRRLANLEEVMTDLQTSYIGRRGSRKLCRVLEESSDAYPARQYVRGRQLSCLTPPEETPERPRRHTRANAILRELQREVNSM